MDAAMDQQLSVCRDVKLLMFSVAFDESETMPLLTCILQSVMDFFFSK